MADKKERFQLIQKYFELGKTYEEITKLVGVSKSTVIREIKKLPANSQEARDFNKKSKTNINNTDNVIISQKDLINQDINEGWVVDLKKLKDEDKQSSHFFMGIIYPENIDIDDFIRFCEVKGYKVALSPYHNKDLWLHDSPKEIDEETGEVIFDEGERYKKGDKKKAHYHYIIQFDFKQNFKTMYSIHMNLANNRVCPKIVYNPFMMYEYLWHKNEDFSKKAHYDKKEVVIINGFCPTLTVSDKNLILSDIVKVVRKNNYTTFEEIELHYKYSTEIIEVLSSRSYHLKNILNEEWKKKNPDYAKPIKIIKDEVEDNE